MDAYCFKRFSRLSIDCIPASARLVMLIGPNGSGKSSLADAMLWMQTLRGGASVGWQEDYHVKQGDEKRSPGSSGSVTIDFHGSDPASVDDWGRAFYVRPPHRNEPSFSAVPQKIQSLRQERRQRRMSDNDPACSQNYLRLVNQVINEVFGDTSLPSDQIREAIIGDINQSLANVFEQLRLTGFGHPMEGGTFRFQKGTSNDFPFHNLSAGERSAFDILIDLHVRKEHFNNTVYFIDEADIHLSTAVQGRLLEEMLRVIPGPSQLWIATHSIGMIRKSRDIAASLPGEVSFLDFTGIDFDQPVTLTPVQPDRRFWEKTFTVALDDLAALIMPESVILCEGAPQGSGADPSFDAFCYNRIFTAEKPNVQFVSGGNNRDVKSDRLVLLSTLKSLTPGLHTVRLIDRDDMSQQEIASERANGMRVLSRRHIESYLLADDVLNAYCEHIGKADKADALMLIFKDELAACVRRGRPADDAKAASNSFYVKARNLLGLTQTGSDVKEFMKYELVPVFGPSLESYQQLKKDIFSIGRIGAI